MSDFEPVESFDSGADLVNGDGFDIWDEQPDMVLPAEEGSEVREVGYPDELAPYWHYQGETQDCALYAQGGVMEADGVSFDIDRYREQGMEEGWYSPEGGTYVDHFGDLMEENGVPVTRYEGASIHDMANELEKGHGVVVAVDCEPLWGEPGGHALWVTGMEVGEDGVPVSIVTNDSGRPDGEAIHYPYQSFMDAWSMYGNIMVATRDRLEAL